jgi:hypothetical protein
MSDLFKPSPNGRRGITDNARENGRCVNPPRFPEIGGMNKGNAVKPNNINIRKPGGGAK